MGQTLIGAFGSCGAVMFLLLTLRELLTQLHKLLRSGRPEPGQNPSARSVKLLGTVAGVIGLRFLYMRTVGIARALCALGSVRLVVPR